jgi:glycosyltransferase involved in cell wall biosynthesis
VLFVGRLSPHKRQDELIRVFALFRRYHAPDARLSLVGDPISESYSALLARLAESLAPSAVRIESGLPVAELGRRFRAAHAFVCLSEHEGFCIPLLEAFHFGVPVIARPAGAIPEVVGDAGLLVADNDPAVVAELLALVLGDAELREELRRRGRARLTEYEPEVIAGRLRAAVEATLGAAVTV